MVNITKTVTKETDPSCTIDLTEEYSQTYEKLKVDEARLTEQKERLSNLLNQLETKAKEEIEKKQNKVEKLNNEVQNGELKWDPRKYLKR